MKGKYFLVLVIAVIALIWGMNFLTQRYNQLSGLNIPSALQIENKRNSCQLAIFGQPFIINKAELSTRLMEVRDRVRQTGEDILNQALDLVGQFTGNNEKAKKEQDLKEKGDQI